MLRTPLRLVDARRLRPAAAAGRADAGLRRAACSAARLVVARPLRLAARRRRLGAARLRLRRRRLTVAELTARLPAAVRRELIEPLCVAALNTPAEAASGTRLPARAARRARRGPGSADLLLPRQAAERAAAAAGARLAARRAGAASGSRTGSTTRIEPPPRRRGWRVDGEAFDASCSRPAPVEAARLVAPHDPAWAARAAALRYEPIVTVYAQQRRHAPARADARAAQPTTSRRRSSSSTAASSAAPPACSPSSSAAPQTWVERGLAATDAATLAQARAELAAHLARTARGAAHDRREARDLPLHARLDRPPAAVAPGLARPATTSTAPTRRRSKARCAAAPRRLAAAAFSGERSYENRRHAKDRGPRPSPSRCWSAPSRCSTCWPRTRIRCR